MVRGRPVVGDTASSAPVSLAVDWAAFLGRHDPVWRWQKQRQQSGGDNDSATQQQPPSTWAKSLFGGNAMLGFMLWQPGNRTVRIDVGRADLYDDRTADSTPHAFTGDFVYDRPRLPIGHLLVQFGVPINSATGRIGLWDAEAQYNVSTGGATTTLRMW
jgi:alpha-L-fucosidase 2